MASESTPQRYAPSRTVATIPIVFNRGREGIFTLFTHTYIRVFVRVYLYAHNRRRRDGSRR